MRTGPRLAAVAVAVILLAGCSGSGSKSAAGGGRGPVADALGRVHATDLTKTAFEFGDTAGLLRLDGGRTTGSAPFSKLFDYGASGIAAQYQLLPDKTGIDLTRATSAITIGRPPNQVGVLYGSFDAAAIGTKLQALGYHKRADGGDTVWTLHDDHRLDPNGPLADLGIVAQLNVVHVSDTRIVYGGAGSDIDQALSGKPTLADDPAYAGLAGCLGDARAAVIQTDPQTWPLPFGVGVTATSATDEEEVLCVATKDDASAKALAAAWPDRVAQGTSQRTAQPWSDLLTAPQAKVVGGAAHIVQLRAHAAHDHEPGVLFDAANTRDLSALLGTPAPTPAKP
ncbi:hypothetical protein [Streptomyces sp. HPF1205]|uniref:hypothetical protein n=1 Tax=Streptomyces sp. HPF1205 TaxID=2873262 RepID=UPI001CEE03EF|nr:hypothetical protein [Streptomyces sp. HPF1205]